MFSIFYKKTGAFRQTNYTGQLLACCRILMDRRLGHAFAGTGDIDEYRQAAKTINRDGGDGHDL